MNSEFKPDPAGENSRRDFIQKIGAVAAASSVAANASAAQQPPAPGRPPEREFRAEPGPLSKQPMPKIRLGKHEVSRLVLGTNGIGTHYSTVLSRTYREWNTPQQMMQYFKHCEELGINMRIQTRDQINQYNKEFGGKMLFSSNAEFFTRGTGPSREQLQESLKKQIANGPIAIHSSASGSDEFWRSGDLKKLREWCKMVQGSGALVCLNGHIPEMYMEIESQGWGVDYYMPALYVFGRTPAEWENLFKATPDLSPLEVGLPQTEYNSQYYGGEIAWVRGDPPKMLKVVKQAKTPCLVFKILASGNLMATAQPKLQQEIVEARFKYVFENIKATDGVVAAMWNKYEDQYALNKEYVVKYSVSSIKV